MPSSQSVCIRGGELCLVVLLIDNSLITKQVPCAMLSPGKESSSTGNGTLWNSLTLPGYKCRFFHSCPTVTATQESLMGLLSVLLFKPEGLLLKNLGAFLCTKLLWFHNLVIICIVVVPRSPSYRSKTQYTRF